MKIKALMIGLGLIQLLPAVAQVSDEYKAFVKEADSLYEAGNYSLSATKFKAAFDELDGKAYTTDRYNAACAYALSSNVDTAFYHLFYLAEHPGSKYRNLSHISTDTDLNILHSDDRWEKLIDIVNANKREYEKDLNLELVAVLDSIYETDQGFRMQISKISEEFGQDSPEMDAHWDLIREADSINELKVIAILDEYGWLGANVVSDKGNLTLFLVIQHAPLETQEKYLPMMREAVTTGNAHGANLAMLEDRVAMRQGKQQIYGSQVRRDPASNTYYVYPVIEPEKVNERRAEVGLGPIESYVFRWNIEWNVEKHMEMSKKQGF